MTSVLSKERRCKSFCILSDAKSIDSTANNGRFALSLSISLSFSSHSPLFFSSSAVAATSAVGDLSQMDGAELRPQLEAFPQYEVQSTVRLRGAVTYHMERRIVIDGEREDQWNEPISQTTQPYIANPMETFDPSQMQSPPLINEEKIDGYSENSAHFNSNPFTMSNQQFTTAGNQLDFNSNKYEAVETKIGMMSESMIPRPFVDPTALSCTPPLTPMNTMPPCDFTQQVYSHGRMKVEDYETTETATAVMPLSNGMQSTHLLYDKMAMGGYPTTGATAAAIPPFDSMQSAYSQYTSTPINDFPPTDAAAAEMDNSGQMRMDSSPIDLSSLNQHSEIEFGDYFNYEASSMLIPQNRNLLEDSTIRENQTKRRKNILVAVPSTQWQPTEYNGLDAAFDLAITNPMPLIQIKPENKVEQRKTGAPRMKDDPMKSLPPASDMEEPTTLKRFHPNGRKRHEHFKNAGEEERIMRDFMSTDDLTCPFECSKGKASATNKRGHLKKYHYDIYFKYCRAKRTTVEEVKERHLGALNGDRICLICDAQYFTQKDMMKHLEKNHKQAFDRCQKEIESAREKETEQNGGKKRRMEADEKHCGLRRLA